MTTTTMHFGPEWMRTKQPPARPNPSPPLSVPVVTAGSSSYSALVAHVPHVDFEKLDTARPFKYSKDEMLKIYKDGGGRGGLGLEVERWEGIVREVGCDPVSLKEMGEGEKKIFAGSLNSEVRRRQSTDYLSPLNTNGPKLAHSAASLASPLRDRMGTYTGRRRDSTDQPPLTLPRKQSLSSIPAQLASPRDAPPLPSPRVRVGMSGFDGVLSDSWTAKRRAAEALAKPGGKPERDGEEPVTSNGHHPTEEHLDQQPHNTQRVSDLVGDGHQNPRDDLGINGAQNTITSNHDTSSPLVSHSSVDPGTQQVDGPSLGTLVAEPLPMGPPPGLDFASVEWSYLDPQGQVQGPFRADVMQKWYDDGYFTPNLLMRRAHIDTEWRPVQELRRLAGVSQLFLVPLNPSVPQPADPYPAPLPGTNHPPGQPFDANGGRGFRTTTLDSYLQNIPNALDSPSSTFSANRFGTQSPDQSSLGGRTGTPLDQPGVLPGRNEQYLDTSSTRTGTSDNQSYTGIDVIDPSANLNPNVVHRPHDFGIINNQGGGSPFVQEARSGYMGYLPQADQARYLNRDPFSVQDPQVGVNGIQVNLGGVPPQPGLQSFGQNTMPPFVPQHDIRGASVLPAVPERRSTGPPTTQQRVRQSPHLSFMASAPSQTGSLSSWPSQDSPRRPGPFDPAFPTSQNTFVAQPFNPPPPQPTYVPTPPNPPTIPHDQSPWFNASRGVVSEGWGGDSAAALTVANLGQHNQQEEQLGIQQIPREIPSSLDVLASAEVVSPAVVPEPAVNSSAPTVTQEVLKPSQKSRKKLTVPSEKPQTQPLAAKPLVSPVASAAKPPSPPQAEPKPAPWAVNDEDKPAPTVMGLREIQEVETKKAEARKAAERDRARAVAALGVSIPQGENLQPFTASWGLPTSQAGSAARMPSLGTGISKDSNSSTPTPNTPTTLVWAGAVKPVVVKKTMKEIQEEEEKQKKLGIEKKESVAAAARRAHAETAKGPSLPQAGGVWATVGANGKSSAASAARPSHASTMPVAAKPAFSAITSSGVSPSPPTVSRSAIVTPSRSSASASTPAKVVANSRAEEKLASTQDFPKWLNESLKGLNSSVNLEEITSMLFSFPLDPDPSTVEIISDLIYANSTTLDGRRFAAEFVSRRKASSRAAVSTGGAGKPLSIADVVKAQPKPVQNEWGGFKVVNKKKKGGRA